LATRGSSSNDNGGVTPITTCKRAVATGTKVMVSTTHHLATAAGLDILRKGGNAFDAAAGTPTNPCPSLLPVSASFFANRFMFCG
jgi:hypothetical protein